ncbi:hypothetical protein JXB27_01380 [Candidatus Woesearchaeota archaeon]|nr:hypothetical protein [Candidatus Woesearchaeota archaeon]
MVANKPSLARQVCSVLEKNPSKVYFVKDVADSLRQTSLDKHILISTILSRLHKKSKIIRTPTQLSNGYLYSLNNLEKIRAIYSKHLVPNYITNRIEEKKELITKNNFDHLKTNEELNINSLFNDNFIAKYRINHFEKIETKKFLAVLVGFCMCDGFVSKNKKRAGFCFRYESDARKFMADFSKVFPKQHLSLSLAKYKSKQSSCSVYVCNPDFSNLLVKLGAPFGRKINQTYEIPTWILNGNNNIKSVFLSTVIGNEGSAPSKNKWRIQFVYSKRKKHIKNLLIFLNQIRAMLFHFGIKTSHIQLRKQEKRNFNGRFYIKGKEDIQKFYKLFSFRYASEKQDILSCLVQNAMNEVNTHLAVRR